MHRILIVLCICLLQSAALCVPVASSRRCRRVKCTLFLHWGAPHYDFVVLIVLIYYIRWHRCLLNLKSEVSTCIIMYIFVECYMYVLFLVDSPTGRVMSKPRRWLGLDLWVLVASGRGCQLVYICLICFKCLSAAPTGRFMPDKCLLYIGFRPVGAWGLKAEVLAVSVLMWIMCYVLMYLCMFLCFLKCLCLVGKVYVTLDLIWWWSPLLLCLTAACSVLWVVL